MKRLLAALLAAVTLAGCSGQTDPATDITHDGAQFNARVSCDPNEPVTTWWQWREVGTTQWTSSNHQQVNCPPEGWTLQPWFRVNQHDLQPNTTYEFVVCGRPGGGDQDFCTNANGAASAQNPTSPDPPRDSFTTLPPPQTEYSAANPPPASWNLYGPNSHFNTPLAQMFPSGIPHEANTAARTASTFNGDPELVTNTNQRWSVPIYHSRSVDPLYDLNVTNFQNKNYVLDLPDQIHLPQGASPALGGVGGTGDTTLWVNDQTDGFVYHCRLGDGGSVNHSTHVITSWRCFRLESEGSGFRFDNEPVPRAAPIRPEELLVPGGDIGHMMSFNTSCVAEGSVGWYSTSDSVGRNICNGDPDELLRFGDVVYLDMTDAQIAALPGPAWSKNVLRGLAHYGAIVERNSGTPQADGTDWNLLFENQLDRTSLGQPNPYSGSIALPLDYSAPLSPAQWKSNMKVVDPAQLPPRP